VLEPPSAFGGSWCGVSLFLLGMLEPSSAPQKPERRIHRCPAAPPRLPACLEERMANLDEAALKDRFDIDLWSQDGPPL